MKDEHSPLHIRARLTFDRSAVPEVVAYLEQIPQAQIAAALSALVTRAVLDLIRSQSPGGQTLVSAKQPERAASNLLVSSVQTTLPQHEPKPGADPLAAFGLEDDGTDAFDYQ